MLDAGERLVPGFRQARALHVWAGVAPALPGRAKASGAVERATSAARTRWSTTTSATA